MKPSRRLLSAVAMLATGSAWGHHSGAMFDTQKTVTLQGSVRTFQWSNPHCWIQLSVPTEGGTAEWSIEMGSITQLYRNGWRPGTLQAGEKVTILVHPTRDGSPGATFMSGTGPDGTPLALGRAGNTP